MKTTLYLVFLGFLFCNSLNAQQNSDNSKKVKPIDGLVNIYQFEDYYLGGQPTLEDLRWLKLHDITRIINLRSESEIETFTSTAFNEAIISKELGFDYYSIPVGGKGTYTTENMDLFIEFVGENEKVFIHCASGGRVCHFLIGYLIKKRGYSLFDAIEVGKSYKLYLPFEDLLDKEIKWHLK